MPNNPLSNSFAKTFTFSTMFNESPIQETYTITSTDPTFNKTIAPQGGAIPVGRDGKSKIYYLRFYLPDAPDIPPASVSAFDKKMIMVYSFRDYQTGIWYDYTDREGLSDGNTEPGSGSETEFEDAIVEWITGRSIFSIPSGTYNKTLWFSVYGKTTKALNKTKYIQIRFSHVQP